MNGTSFVAGMAAGAAILGAGMLMGGMQRAQQAKPAELQDAVFGTITASAVQIVNDKGVVQLSLRSTRTGGELGVMNAQGKGAVMMGARRGGGELAIADDSERKRLSLEPDGALVVFGPDGKKRAQVASFKMDGNTKSDFSGQFVAFDRNEAQVEKVPE